MAHVKLHLWCTNLVLAWSFLSFLIFEMPAAAESCKGHCHHSDAEFCLQSFNCGWRADCHLCRQPCTAWIFSGLLLQRQNLIGRSGFFEGQRPDSALQPWRVSQPSLFTNSHEKLWDNHRTLGTLGLRCSTAWYSFCPICNIEAAVHMKACSAGLHIRWQTSKTREQGAGLGSVSSYHLTTMHGMSLCISICGQACILVQGRDAALSVLI